VFQSLSKHTFNLFQILNFSKPVTLPPQKLVTPFILKFHPKVGILHFRTLLTLHTNASEFLVELVIYNGQLKVSLRFLYVSLLDVHI